jgi:phage gpG-like protein
MTLEELEDYFDGLPDQIMDDVPHIVAETAVQYFKESFSLKEFDKNPWEPAKKEKSTGSLMVTSGNLMNSINAPVADRNHVIVQAGNDKVGYAQAHNEGFTGPVVIPAHTRRTRNGTAEVKEYTMNQNLPQRQFLGASRELMDMIKDRIDDFLRSIL